MTVMQKLRGDKLNVKFIGKKYCRDAEGSSHLCQPLETVVHERIRGVNYNATVNKREQK
jgi:hypothetical protein